MFQIIKHQTNIDFIGVRRPMLIISMMLNIAILAGIALFGFNFGIDFAGGTLVEVKFDHPITPAEVRTRAQSGGLHDATVQGIGSKDENSFLLRLGGTTQLTKDGAEKAKAALAGLGELKNVYADLDNGLINFRAAKKVDPAQAKKLVEDAGTSVFQVRDMGEAQGGGYDYQVV